jgi:hypothetical protein
MNHQAAVAEDVNTTRLTVGVLAARRSKVSTMANNVWRTLLSPAKLMSMALWMMAEPDMTMMDGLWPTTRLTTLDSFSQQLAVAVVGYVEDLQGSRMLLLELCGQGQGRLGRSRGYGSRLSSIESLESCLTSSDSEAGA